MLERETLVHWSWLVYLEMFVAGTAAGAYVTAAILELLGRGRSPLARTAHLVAFPLLGLAGLLLIVDLQRPERFWHMLVQSERLLPMLKWWSPMSAGSWGLMLFGGFAFVSFVDALISLDQLRFFGWRAGRTLHGSWLGGLWSILGGIAAFFVGGYSGVLLNVTNIPLWRDTAFLGALFVPPSRRVLS
jgi:formate-dependent nitrite reductase membrane component NrfD